MNAELSARLDAKRQQTIEMAWRLGAEGICVDEGNEHSLPVVEWWPEDAKNLLLLAADTVRFTQSDCDAIRKVAKDTPAGEAYRVESCPSLYRLRTDPRNIQELMERLYEDVAEAVEMGIQEKLARRNWITERAAEELGCSPIFNTAQKSSLEIKFKNKIKSIAQRIGNFERKHGRKRLRAGSPT